MAVVVGEAAVRIRADADPKQIEDDSSGPILDALGAIGGKGAAILGGAIGGAALASAFGTAMENGAIEDKFAARLGLTEDQSAAIGDTAGSLYAQNYGESMEDVYGSVEAVMTSIDGMSTASSDALEAMTGRALNFASAFDVDVTAATQTAGNLIKNGLAKDGTAAFDLLTRSFQTVPAAMREELPAILDEYGTNFRALGFTGEQAFALLGGAAEGGAIVLDKTGDALKEFTIRGSDMSAASVAAYESIGLSAESMSDLIARGGPGAQEALQKTAAGLLGISDPADRANQAIALFGSPLEDLGVDKIPGFLEAVAGVGPGMTDAAGSVDALGTTLNDNASSNLASFGRQAQQLATDFLGGQLLPMVETVASSLATNFGPAVEVVAGFVGDTLIPAVRSLAEWIGENQTPILIVAGIIGSIFLPHLIAMGVESVKNAALAVGGWVAQQAATIAAAATHSAQIGMMLVRWVAMGAAAVLNAAIAVASWVGMGIAAVANAAVVAAAWLGAQIATVASLAVMAGGFIVQGAIMVASVLATVASVVAGWVVMAAGALLSAGQMALAWFIALGPIGWVIAAVIGLVALIIANWETVKNWTIAAFTAVSDFLVGIWEWIKGIFTAALDAIIGAVQWYLTLVWTVISTVFTTILGVVTGAWNAIGNGIRAALDWIWNLVSGAFTKVRDFVGSVFSGLASTVGAIWDGIAGAIKGAINGIIDLVNNFVIKGVNVLIDGVNFVNPFDDIPHIPRIPKLHSGGRFDSGQGEGLALLRDRELVVTPEQESDANGLLGSLLAGNLSGAGGGVSVPVTIYQQPGESAAALAARVTQGVVWNLNGGITRPVSAGAAS